MKPYVYLFTFLLVFTSCLKDNEQSNVSTQNCANTSFDELAVDFCLLSIDSVPATSFRQGENIIFALTLHNLTSDQLTIKPAFLHNHPFAVRSQNDIFGIGTPITGVWCQFSLNPQELVLAKGTSITLRAPWFWDDEITPTYPLCKADSNPVIPPGNYISMVDLDFSIENNASTNIIDGPQLTVLFAVEN
ncbi:hypothetical protein [Echinicola vietnamensis]|uniref:Intracellular proteinase inhibitor BsuPI domain-containing protein n=1 Tax=Echinicola vietnamensis (strain DSM 17526 / LMG 23754 / KMM 6221) TaxID=926556 RepID=L0FVW8_ECHVK|nr:hypothetical protein [Echinicola vietnamensis]AGA76815.1 hypothetical protein Echvi_0536 [Echinicola vietnamensis DSM 17526]